MQNATMHTATLGRRRRRSPRKRPKPLTDEPARDRRKCELLAMPGATALESAIVRFLKVQSPLETSMRSPSPEARSLMVSDAGTVRSVARFSILLTEGQRISVRYRSAYAGSTLPISPSTHIDKGWQTLRTGSLVVATDSANATAAVRSTLQACDTASPLAARSTLLHGCSRRLAGVARYEPLTRDESARQANYALQHLSF